MFGGRELLPLAKAILAVGLCSKKMLSCRTEVEYVRISHARIVLVDRNE